MNLLLVDIGWFHPLSDFLIRAFQHHKIDVEKISCNNNYLSINAVRKLKHLKLYGFIGNNFPVLMNSFIDKKLYAKNNELLLSELSKNKYDILFIIRGAYIHSETLQTIKQKYPKIKIVIWFIDDPVFNWSTFPPSFENDAIKSFYCYDAILVYDEYFIDFLKRLNKEVYCFPFAFDEQIFNKKKVTKEYNISFVGSDSSKERIEILNELTNFDIALFGNGWKSFEKYKIDNNIDCLKANDVYNKSWINLNIHNPQTIYGLNTRNFEVIGSGNFLITDYRNSMKNYFEPGKEIETYYSIKELKEKIRYYIEHKDKLNEIADNGYIRAKKEHTYIHRVEYLIRNIFL
ncbi:glycosyltransferase [Candidatus Dependentiae bacterium]|nr:glycosyltransferase [Candidatus Dependentiae bacterium]